MRCERAQHHWYLFLSFLEGRGVVLNFWSNNLDSCSESSWGINQELLPLLASLSQDWLSWRGSIESAVTHKVSHCSDQGVDVAWLEDLEREQQQLPRGISRKIGAFQRDLNLLWRFSFCWILKYALLSSHIDLKRRGKGQCHFGNDSEQWPF